MARDVYRLARRGAFDHDMLPRFNGELYPHPVFYVEYQGHWRKGAE
jgi:hypothetical protein